MDLSHFKSPQDAWRQRCGNQTACCFCALRWRLKTFWKKCKRNICMPQSDVRPLGFFFAKEREVEKKSKKMWHPSSPSSWTLGLKRYHCIRCFLSLASFPKAMLLSPVCSTLRCATITVSEMVVASLHEQILITALHKVEPSNTGNSSQNDEE